MLDAADEPGTEALGQLGVARKVTAELYEVKADFSTVSARIRSGQIEASPQLDTCLWAGSCLASEEHQVHAGQWNRMRQSNRAFASGVDYPTLTACADSLYWAVTPAPSTNLISLSPFWRLSEGLNWQN